MKVYLAQLNEIVEAKQCESKLRQNIDELKQLNKQRELARRSKPLTEQITELMNSLPPHQRDKKWSMDELVTRLTGKYRNLPHPQHVGIALRKLGWRRVRCWKQGFDGVRLWVPPSCD